MIPFRKSVSLVFFCCSLLLLVQSVAAFTVASVAVSPSGNLYPGNSVNISYTVYVASGTAFSSYDDLQFVTDLEDPRWTYSIAVNGVKNTRPVTGDHTITINGFELGYRNQDEVIVYVLLQGTIPRGSVLGANKTLAKIQELDARGYSIGYSAVTIDHLIGEPTPTPTPAYGSLTVSSSPAGANVYIDNVYKGLSPATFSGVPNGNHVILIKMDGYQDLTKSVTIQGDTQILSAALAQHSAAPVTTAFPGQTLPAGNGSPASATIAHSPGHGALSITTTPAGALVYVDGMMMGVTPATIPMLEEGPHSVTLVMDGYQDLKTTITINAGTTSEYITGLSKPAKSPGFGPVPAVVSLGIFFLLWKRRE